MARRLSPTPASARPPARTTSPAPRGQGEIVVAARDRIVDGGFANDPAGFIDAMGRLVQTSVDPEIVGRYAGQAAGLKRDHMYRAVIQYPLVHGARNDLRGSILVPPEPDPRARCPGVHAGRHAAGRARDDPRGLERPDEDQAAVGDVHPARSDAEADGQADGQADRGANQPPDRAATDARAEPAAVARSDHATRFERAAARTLTGFTAPLP